MNKKNKKNQIVAPNNPTQNLEKAKVLIEKILQDTGYKLIPVVTIMGDSFSSRIDLVANNSN